MKKMRENCLYYSWKLSEFVFVSALGSDPGHGLQLHYAAFVLQRTMPQSAVCGVDKKNTSFDR